MPLSIASWTRCQPATGAAAESPASTAMRTRRPFLSFAYGASRDRPVCLCGKGLVSEEGGEETAAREELLRSAVLDDPALVEHDRDVGNADRREPLGRDEHGA